MHAPDIGGDGNFRGKLPLVQFEPLQSNWRSVFETISPVQTTSQAGNKAILETVQEGEAMRLAFPPLALQGLERMDGIEGDCARDPN